VRGICTIRPGVPGLSEKIRVRSILGRFLEHSRLFWFANGGQPSVGIGSADLMHRNLDRRVEVLASITNPAHIAEISEQFEIAFDKGTASWKLQPDGTWIPFMVDDQGQPLLDMQEYLINATSRRRASAK
jgi:polyphosphate kinase